MDSVQREKLKFFAVWELSRRVTPRKRKEIGAEREQHTIMLVEKPLSERYKKNHEYLSAFWIYLDGFEAYYYARQVDGEIQGMHHFTSVPYAPEEERFLLALTAAHALFPDTVDRSLPLPLQIEQKGTQVQKGELWLTIPSSPEGGMMHPYTQQRKQWLVGLGGGTCEVVCYVYNVNAFWFRGECWQESVENWVFMPASEEAIEVYARPGNLQMRKNESKDKALNV